MPQRAKDSRKDNDSKDNSLRAEVLEALRFLLRDPSASAAAKASAARTLMEFFDNEKPASSAAPAEMSLDELDAEITRLTNLRG